MTESELRSHPAFNYQWYHTMELMPEILDLYGSLVALGPLSDGSLSGLARLGLTDR